MKSLEKEIEKAVKNVLVASANEKAVSNILRLKSKEQSTEELINLALKELNTIRIAPIWGTDKERKLLIKSFFNSSQDFISEKIKSNKLLNSAIQELARVFNADDTLFNYTIRITDDFIGSIINSILTLEIHYLNYLKDNLNISQRLQKKNIIGKILSYDLDIEKIKINDIELSSLLDSIGEIVRYYSILLRMKNSEWLEYYLQKHQELEREKTYYERERIERRVKDVKEIRKVGRPSKFSSEIEFHKRIKSIPNWKDLSKTVIANKLGYKSSSGLNELIKTKGWKLPK